MRKLQYPLLALLAIVLATASFLALKGLMNNDKPTEQPDLDTVVNMRVAFWSPDGTLRHSMRLACREGKPLAATRGFNLDIPRQAKIACRRIVNLPSGDYSCPALAGKKVTASGSAEGVVKGRKLKANFELVNSKSCERYYRFWKQFQDVWNLKGKSSKANEVNAERSYKKSKQRNQRLDQKLKRDRREAQQNTRRQDQQNERFLAPGSKPSN